MEVFQKINTNKYESLYVLSPLENHTFELSRNLAMLDAIIEATADGMVVYSLEGHIAKLNSTYCDMIDLDKYDAYSVSVDDHISRLYQLCTNAKAFFSRIEKQLHSQKTDRGFILKFKDDRYFQITHSPYLINGHLIGRVIAFHDVTLQKRTELSLIEREALYKDLSIRDNLTGIFNRRKLLMTLKACFSSPKFSETTTSLIFFDLDHFKSINDHYGHAVGDIVLKRVSESISACLRKKDVFGRWGGDEFMIILPDTDKTKAEKIMRRVLSRLSTLNLPINDSVTCSYGISSTKEENCPEALIHQADMAMYHIKQCSKSAL